MRNLFIVFLLISQSALAHPPKAYLNIEPGLFSGPAVFIVNGKEFRTSFWSPYKYSFSEEMSDHSLAYEYAKKHESYANWSSVFFWAGFGGSMVYLFTVPHSDHKLNTFIIIFAGGMLPAGILGQRSYSYLHKAMNAYNGIESSESARWDFGISPVKGGATVSVELKY